MQVSLFSTHKDESVPPQYELLPRLTTLGGHNAVAQMLWPNSRRALVRSPPNAEGSEPTMLHLHRNTAGCEPTRSPPNTAGCEPTRSRPNTAGREYSWLAFCCCCCCCSCCYVSPHLPLPLPLLWFAPGFLFFMLRGTRPCQGCAGQSPLQS